MILVHGELIILIISALCLIIGFVSDDSAIKCVLGIFGSNLLVFTLFAFNQRYIAYIILGVCVVMIVSYIIYNIQRLYMK